MGQRRKADRELVGWWGQNNYWLCCSPRLELRTESVSVHVSQGSLPRSRLEAFALKIQMSEMQQSFLFYFNIYKTYTNCCWCQGKQIEPSTIIIQSG